MSTTGCEQELCPNWSGDGNVCPCAVFGIERRPEPNDGPGMDGRHVVTGECFACMVGVWTGPESHADDCVRAKAAPPRFDPWVDEEDDPS